MVKSSLHKDNILPFHYQKIKTYIYNSELNWGPKFIFVLYNVYQLNTIVQFVSFMI